MSRVALSVLIVLSLVTGTLSAQTDREPNPHSPHLVILAAQPDAANIILHVTGRNFCEAPSITFGDTPVGFVGTPTETSIDVLLPVGVQSGTYRLEISCGKGAVRNDVFFVTIAAPQP